MKAAYPNMRNPQEAMQPMDQFRAVPCRYSPLTFHSGRSLILDHNVCSFPALFSGIPGSLEICDESLWSGRSCSLADISTSKRTSTTNEKRITVSDSMKVRLYLMKNWLRCKQVHNPPREGKSLYLFHGMTSQDGEK